jgi:soluble lytic murein transglycosylase-like protein
MRQIRLPMISFLFVAAFTFNMSGAVWASIGSALPDNQACEREMLRAAREHKIPVNVLYAVSLTESGRRGRLDPFAINIEGKAAFSQSREEAMEKVRTARARGAKLIDIGCMQINHHYHASRFSSLSEMFDPARNVDYGARFLIELKLREGTWTMAVARYHAGASNTAAQKTYICKVIQNMVASGLGEWTPAAKSFCAARALINR